MEEHKSSISNKQELQNLSIKDVFYKYIRFLPVFILSIAIALLGAFIYLRYATSIYSANGTMLIKNTKANSGSTDRVEDILSGGNRNQNLQNEIELLKSRPLMMRVVEKLNLQLSYIAEGRVKDMNAYAIAPFSVELIDMRADATPFSVKIIFQNDQQFRLEEGGQLFSFGQSIQNRNGHFMLIKKGPIVPGSIYIVSWRSPESVAQSLVSNLKVLPKTPGTGIITISMDATSPRQAADIVNNLMIQYDSVTVEQNNYSADQMIGFIDGRLNKLKTEIDSLQLIELNFRQKENLFDINLQSENFFSKLSDVDKAASEQELRINTVNYVDEYVKDKQNQYNRVVPSALGLEDLTLNELVMGYNKAQLERQVLLNSNIPPNNPSIKEANEIIEKQRENLVESLKNLKLSYAGTINKLRANIDVQQGELKELPYKVKELVEIQRQISTKVALYGLLEGKREETAIGRASTISNSTVVDRATVSAAPVKPNRQVIQILAAVAGLLLPAFIIFIAELLNDKISTRMDVEKGTDAPIVGEVGHSYSDRTLVVTRTSRGMVGEQFRIIRSNLQYIINHIQNPVILVTSSFSGEGKSFVSTNMAAVMALTGKKTVILEFDIRKPKVLAGLNMQKLPGISNFLVGKAQLKDLIVPAPDYENLFVLPCGPIPPNPAELILDDKVTEMFDWLKTNFEVVIIDTAPVGMVSDAMTLAKFADCTLYIVRQGYTFKKQTILIDEMYKEKKLPRISVVVNDVKLKAGYGYYGYGRYGYGYGYGEKGGYYEEEVQGKSFLNKFLSILNPINWFRKKK
jgi:tyrosine-protein kinase Etk/Wzc